MGYEILYKYHPKLKEGVGYDTEVIEEKNVKVGKPFDDSPLDKCAAAIMGQLARRDVWVVDVEVHELVKKQISFKEAKDGKGIVLKNRKFSLNQTAQLVTEDVVEAITQQQHQHIMAAPQAQVPINPNLHPHEMAQHSPAAQMFVSTDDLYANSDKATTVRRTVDPRTIDRTRKLYQVYYEPYMWKDEARSMRLKFSEDTRYNVHSVIHSASGKLDAQQIALTDDSGQVVILDEKYFTRAGGGLVGDDEVGFSEPRAERRKQRNKLMYENEMVHDAPPMDNSGISVDDGTIPSDLLVTPNLRPDRQPDKKLA